MTEDPMDRPYTEAQVFALEQDAERIAHTLMFSRTHDDRWWTLVEGEDDTLAALIYDALVALRNEMTMEDD